MKNKISLFIISFFAVIFLFISPVYAADLDEIVNYNITVIPNVDDATLNIYYDIDWKVLDSKSEGPLEWVKVGIPNSHTLSYEATTDTVDKISTTSSGGYYMRLDLDRKYYADETVHFGFMIVQDYMYQVNKFEEGYTVYSFTPGWFPDAKVDNLTISWLMDDAYSWSPDCVIENGYLVFNTSLSKGEKYPIDITYANDALGFDLTKQIEDSSSSKSSVIYDFFVSLFAIIIVLISFSGPIAIFIAIVKSLGSYARGGNLGNTDRKITRTKVTYYPSCQGCGAVRKEGEQFCTYCGRSFVKSEEVIKEDKLKPEDKGVLKFSRDGEYRYNSPNTYIRVNSVIIPRPRTTTSSRSSSSHHSSCAHSSCACACACACAGGGRAGCTTKDFYNTNLKLKQLELKIRGKKWQEEK